MDTARTIAEYLINSRLDENNDFVLLVSSPAGVAALSTVDRQRMGEIVKSWDSLLNG